MADETKVKNRIGDDEHVFIAGMTGSGKTFLAQVYAAGIEKQVFVLDTKGTFDWPYLPPNQKIIVGTLAELPTAAGQHKNIIYRPIREELTDAHYNSFFQFCYYLGNCTVLVDEVMQVCPTPSRIPEFYKGILTRGRELNVNVWSATQRPATIPVVVYSEATHWFIFKLNAAPDRDRLADFTGWDELREPVPKQVFYYFDANQGSAPQRGKLVMKGGN